MTGLRFLMVTTFYPPFNFGGEGITVQRLSRALVGRGHDVTVVHDGDAFVQLAGHEPVEAAATDGVTVVTLRSRFPRISLLATHQLGRPVVHRRRLRSLLRDPGVDVINYHNVSLAGGPGILATGTALKAYTAHEHWLVCPTHTLWRHGREPCPARQCLRCVARYRRPPQWWRYSGLLDRMAKHVDVFFALSEFSRAKHREFGFSQPMEVLPCFLPDGPAAPAPAQSPHERPYFFFAGRLERIKGLDDVIPIMPEVPEADLLVAGDGTHRPSLGVLAGGNPQVRFLGRLAPDDLRRYYRHAVAAVVPSLCYETFGLSVIEAFREGVPVVVRRRGPLVELVRQSGAGLEFTTPSELRLALRELLERPDHRATLANRAIAAFQTNWTDRVVIAAYLSFLERAARDTGRHALADRFAACVR